MSDYSENIAFQKFKTGDAKAFKFLFSRYFQSLYLFALKFVDDEIAKDLVQDCFYDLWRNREKVNIKSSLSAYLFTTVKNRCYTHLKKEQARSSANENIHLQLKTDELSYFLHSEKSVLEFDTVDRIKQTIAKLPERCREIFVESRFNGLTNSEIAEKCNISVKAVEKQISKALKAFREEFREFLALFFMLLSQKK